MVARFRSWWQQIKQHPVRSAVSIGAGLLGIALLVAFIGGYFFHWDWTGFSSYTPPVKDSNFQRGKTLWDWLNLVAVLAIPAAVTLGVAWYTVQQGKVSSRENTDNHREATLRDYIDKMTELLLDRHLRESSPNDEVRTIARVRTIAVLFQLDARRIGYVFTFLRETGLMSEEPNSGIISMRGANLSMIDLSQTNISSVNLSGANLRGANLSNARLTSAELTEVSLDEANLTNANLSFANLSGASFLGGNLSGANFWGADLSRARFCGADLSNANLSDASLRQANFADLIIKKMNGADFIETRYGEANLSGANLSKANLRDASVTPEQLDKAKLLKDTIMHDGSKHP
jgi:uncharacterized protein YjbI with pentapeptide repeats